MTLRNTCGVLFFGGAPKVRGYDTNTEAIDWSTFSIMQQPLQKDTHTRRLFAADRNSSPGERLVIIGKPFEGCRYADGEDAGLLNMACKTHPARQQSAHSPPQLNDLVN